MNPSQSTIPTTSSTSPDTTSSTTSTAPTTSPGTSSIYSSTTPSSSTSPDPTTSGAIASLGISSRIIEWRLSSVDIQKDLDDGVTIVRSKDSVVGAPTGSTDDEVLKTMVKGKLQADSDTSKAMIEVEAKNGEIMLTGSADSAATVGRSMALALDTQGATKVSSDVKVSAQVK